MLIMNRNTKILVFLLVGLIPPFSQGIAQSASGDTLRLEEAVAVALANNLDIRVAATEKEIADNDVRFMDAAFLPQLNGNFTRNFSTSTINQELSNGTKTERNNVKGNVLNAGVAMNWLLFDGLRMFATRQKIQELQVLGDLNVKNSIQNTVFNVIITYYAVVRQQQQLKAIIEQMDISNERLLLAERRFETGLGSKVDVLQAKVDLNAQKSAMLQQQTLIEQSKTTLRQLLNIKDEQPFLVTETIPVKKDLSITSLQETALLNNITLQQVQQNKTVAALTLKEFKADRFPRISFNSNYTLNRNKSEAGLFLLNQNAGFGYGLTATVPILNNFNNRRQIQAASIDIKRLDLQYQNEKIRLQTVLLNAFKEYQFQLKALALEEENLLLAKENVVVALARFKQGLSTTVEVKQAQVSLEEAYNRLISTRYNAKLAESQLQLQQGAFVMKRG
jgi:outer membrane protein